MAYVPVPEKQARLAGALRGSGPQMRLPGLHRAPSSDDIRVPLAVSHSQPQTRLLKSVALKLPCFFLRECSQLPWMLLNESKQPMQPHGAPTWPPPVALVTSKSPLKLPVPTSTTRPPVIRQPIDPGVLVGVSVAVGVSVGVLVGVSLGVLVGV